MEFKKLREEVLKEINKRYVFDLNKLNEEDFKRELSYYHKSYIGNLEQQKGKFLKFIEKKRLKQIEEELNLIKSIEEAKDFGGELVLTIEWKKSNMWGMNPKVFTNYGFEGESIGGCGYCKTSTATAQGLNSHKPILKELFKKEEERLNLKTSKDRRNFVGYGSGYGIIPIFEGGVGVSSHETILKNLGLNMRSITETKTTNVYLIKRMTKREVLKFKERGY